MHLRLQQSTSQHSFRGLKYLRQAEVAEFDRVVCVEKDWGLSAVSLLYSHCGDPLTILRFQVPMQDHVMPLLALQRLRVVP